MYVCTCVSSVVRLHGLTQDRVDRVVGHSFGRAQDDSYHGAGGERQDCSSRAGYGQEYALTGNVEIVS